MNLLWIFSFAEGVSLTVDPRDRVILSGPRGIVTMPPLTPSSVAALGRLVTRGATLGRLAESVVADDGPNALPRFLYLLRDLVSRGLVQICVDAEQVPLAALAATNASYLMVSAGANPEQPLVLSRFAFLRRRDEVVVLETPLAATRVIVHDCRVIGLIHALSRPATLADLHGRDHKLPGECVHPLLDLLAAAGALTVVNGASTTDEEDNPVLRTWEFHDLLFHTRSRDGRYDGPFGGVYLHAGKLPPPPAAKPSSPGEVIPLHRPDLDRLERKGPTFTSVLEGRRSIREYAAAPLTVAELGEFLFRAARVRQNSEYGIDTPTGEVRIELTSRPYPGGGSLHELEIYLVIQSCAGLAPGLYRYDPTEHQLERLTGPTSETSLLLRGASLSSGIAAERLQVLLVLAARFQRINWKYSGMAYALILKNVGVLYQTLYLTATALGLAPCGLGAGNSDLFARALGSDYYEETSVGEFLIGSREESDTA